MGMPPNPLGGQQAGMIPAVLAALAARAQGAGGGGAGMGGGPSPATDFSQQSAGLQGADPTLILRQLEQINQLLGVLFVRSFSNQPNLANNISGTMKQLSRAIKEAQQGSNVAEAIKPTVSNQSGSTPILSAPAREGMPDTAQLGPAMS